MLMIVTENVPPRLRGRLALWLVEVRAGVYVGDYGERVREMIWQTLLSAVGDGNAVMAWTSPCEAGFELRVVGDNKRQVVDFDGLKLCSYVSDEAATAPIMQAFPQSRPPPTPP